METHGYEWLDGTAFWESPTLQDPITEENKKAYKEFLEHYQDPIVDLLSTTPPMAPEEYKETVYILTKYYPNINTPIFDN